MYLNNFSRKYFEFIFWTFLAFSYCPKYVTSSWWYLSEFNETNFQSSPRLLCRLVQNFSPSQKRICENHSDLVLTLGDSVRSAISECQSTFRFNRWNCSVFRQDPSVFGKKFIKSGTRELAFVQALTSASAVLSITRACSVGRIHCACSLKNEEMGVNKRFKWSGCKESPYFALNFVRKFIDSGEKGRRDPRAKMSAYNNKAGRDILVRESIERCKCHGLSGSCTLKSCWRLLPPLPTVASSLYATFNSAIKVEFDPRGRLRTVESYQKKPSTYSLIYYKESGEECGVDEGRGYLGTSNRVCNDSSEGVESCDILCCGKGHYTLREIHTKSCHCVFNWCCEVKCQTCEEIVSVSRCDASLTPLIAPPQPLIPPLKKEKKRRNKKSNWVSTDPSSDGPYVYYERTPKRKNKKT